MAHHDPRIDAYIAKSADFAKPILQRLRDIVHEACPDVEETVKWGMPSFLYAGGILCGMAAFKQHVSFGFWKHALVMDNAERDGMGSFGKITKPSDLPSKRELIALIRKAMRLNEQGAKAPAARRAATPKPPQQPPGELLDALKKNRKASAAFAAFSPSQQREYTEWISEAKRGETRQRRLEQAIEWIAEGKPRHWKYMTR
jgi:uncharacterized protein YdeI (YjbR/CyaY-like superfamily)